MSVELIVEVDKCCIICTDEVFDGTSGPQSAGMKSWGRGRVIGAVGVGGNSGEAGLRLLWSSEIFSGNMEMQSGSSNENNATWLLRFDVYLWWEIWKFRTDGRKKRLFPASPQRAAFVINGWSDFKTAAAQQDLLTGQDRSRSDFRGKEIHF